MTILTKEKSYKMHERTTKCLCQLGVMCKYKALFSSFRSITWAETRFENPSRHKHKRWASYRYAILHVK